MKLGSIIILSSRILEDFFVHFRRMSLRQYFMMMMMMMMCTHCLFLFSILAV